MSPRTVIYARVSRDRDGRSTSVTQQVDECHQYATRHDLDVVEVLSDNDISAYTGKRRPAYEQLLDNLEAGKYDAVLVWAQDRLTRRPMELEQYITVCEPRSIPTYSVSGGSLDLTTSQGRMTARILGAVNRQEVDQLRSRVSRAIKARANQGLPYGGRRPFGFADDRVTHHPVEAEAVREASESFLRGESLYSIAKRWREAGLTTTGVNAGKSAETGETVYNEWNAQRLGDLLARPRNAGWIEYKGTITGRASWEPLVSPETWSAVRAILTDPARRTSPGNQPAYLGSYVYRCGVCGEPMRIGRGGGKRPRSYKCSSETRKPGEKHPIVQQEPADHFVADFVVRGLHEQGFVIADDAGSSLDAARDREKRREELESRRRTLVRNHVAGLLSDADLDEALTMIARQLEDLDTGELASEVAHSDIADLVSQTTAWDEFPIDRQRAILREFAEVTILPATSTRQPTYTEADGVLRSDRIRVRLRLEV